VKYAVQTGSSATIYIPSYIKIDSGIQKLTARDSDTQTAWWSHKPSSIFSKQGKEAINMIPTVPTLTLKDHNFLCEFQLYRRRSL
jgi:hypothetical protein